MTTQQLLDDARSKRHALLTGTAAVDVWDGEFRVTYKPADIDALQRYIADLESRLSIELGTTATSARRPLTFVF